MRSIADDLRSEVADRVLRLPLLERVELALALGRDDLNLYVLASGLSPDAARRHLAAQRRNGRSHSRSADPGS